MIWCWPYGTTTCTNLHLLGSVSLIHLMRSLYAVQHPADVFKIDFNSDWCYRFVAQQIPQFQGNLQIQSDCRSIEVKLVLNEPKQPNCDPLAVIPEIESVDRADESSMESDDGSVGSKKPSRKRKSLRNANNNEKERPPRDDSPDTKERNELANILFSTSEKRFKRNLDQPLYTSNECKLRKPFLLVTWALKHFPSFPAGGLFRISPPPYYISVLRKDEGLADLYEDQL